jgi:hypothetical protein
MGSLLAPRRAGPVPAAEGAVERARLPLKALLVAAAIFGSGCDLDGFGDLGEKLLDPDVQSLDVPGERWLEGPHFDLSIQANEDGSRFALARSDDDELAIVNFAEQTHCRIGPIARYGAAIQASGQPALIPLLIADEVNGPQLGFTNFACERSGFQVSANALPVETVDGRASPSGTALLVKTPEQGLTLVDPWSQTARSLAESVRSNDPVVAFGHFLWIDRGVIVISDAALEPVAFFGTDVSEVSISAENAELAYVERSGAESQGGTLFVVSATGSDTPREVATDACNVRYLTVARRRQLSYLSPCTERRLIFQDSLDDSIRVIDANVAGTPAVRTVGGESLMTYLTTASSDTSTGTLWVVQGDADAVAIAENTRVGPSTVTGDGSLLTVLDWASNGGRLVSWKQNAVTDVAEGVVELETLGRLANDDLTLIGNYDGVTGDLLRLGADLSIEVLARGVPTRPANGNAFLANFDGTAGELMLFDRDDGSTELIGAGVARGSFIFAQQWRGIMMLAARDTETSTSTLRMRLLESGREYEVHQGVTEAREVAFPSPGLLYNVVIGDDAGVWFSKTL